VKSYPIVCCAVGLMLVVGNSSVFAQRSRGGTLSPVLLQGNETAGQIQQAYVKAVNELVPTLTQSDGRPLQSFEAMLHHAARPGAEVERAACGKAIAAALLGEAAPEAKAWMLKLVAFAGRAEVVPAAARLLGDRDPLVRESARYALQHLAVPEAAEALRAALTKASEPTWQAALALALGARQDAVSVPGLTRLLAAREEATVEAALSALGKIANDDAARALARAQRSVPEKLRPAAAESWMKCAEQMLARGRRSDAAAIYRELNQPGQPRPVRLAAQVGLLRSSGNEAGAQVLQLLASDDADTRAVAAGYIAELRGSDLKTLASGMNRLPPATQVLVLGALAERREKSALPEALACVKSADEYVRFAGLYALGQLGDATTVPLLAATLQAGGSAASAARTSLVRLDGPGVNDAILAAMQREKEPDRRAELVMVLEVRGTTTAVPALLQEALSEAPAPRRAAMRALGRLAAPDAAPAMLQALLKSAPGGERHDAERAVASVCLRASSPASQVQPVLEAYRDAKDSEKAALLPVLGRLGGPKAFEAVKAALASSDPALQKAAETALANWPDADESVEAELLGRAQRAEKAAERAAALRAYLRVIALPSGLPEKARIAKFRKAMDLAERDAERNLALERAAEIRHIETLRFVVPYLDQPALAQRAGTTVVELTRERGLRERNRAEFEQALNKVLEVCKDPALTERVKRRLQEK
jgi:HEAT repeat protein